MKTVTILGAIYLFIVVSSFTGCLQLTGADYIDAWGLKMQANKGFEVKAGVMQYDNSNEQKGSTYYKGNTK